MSTCRNVTSTTSFSLPVVLQSEKVQSSSPTSSSMVSGVSNGKAATGGSTIQGAVVSTVSPDAVGNEWFSKCLLSQSAFVPHCCTSSTSVFGLRF